MSETYLCDREYHSGMSDDTDHSAVRSSTEYARTRTRCPNCGDHVPAAGGNTEATECPNCHRMVRT